MKRSVAVGLCFGVLMWWGPGIVPGSASAEPRTALRPVADDRLPALLDVGDAASLREAIIQSLAWLTRQPPRRPFAVGARTVTAGEQARALERVLEFLAEDPAPDLLEAFLLDEFEVMRSVGQGDGTMLVTGYHEVTVDAALEPSAEYHVPILAAPANLAGRSPVTSPYPTRAEIEAGRLAGRAGPLAWARDRVDVFFMEVEGSGTLRLTDGREVRVGYAGTNGRPYRSIARLLIDEGHIDREAMSMRALREWLAANPDQLTRVLHHNPSYVFFGRRAGPPVGSLGVPLTPGRSIATDPQIFPPGSLAFLLTDRPQRRGAGDLEWRPVSRLVLSQDVGGVIRGPGRVDVFWGRGPDADLAASEMKQPGELYVLVPRRGGIRPLSPPRAPVVPDVAVDARAPVVPDARPDERAPAGETGSRATGEPITNTHVADAGVRALGQAETVEALVDPDTGSSTAF